MSQSIDSVSRHPLNPFFWHLSDEKGRQRACLLGTMHDMRLFFPGENLKAEIPEVFGSRSAVQKCFSRASRFFEEQVRI